MQWFKVVFASALAVLFVVSALMAMFSVGRSANVVLKNYVLEVQDCYPVWAEPVPADGKERAEPTQECRRDDNQIKRDLADSASMALVAFPLALITFWQLRRMMR